MKKRIASLLLAAVMVIGLAACGGSGSSAGSTGGSSAASGSGSSSGKIAIKAATQHSEDFPTTVALMKFKEDLESKSNGAFQVDVYSGGQLGTETDIVSQMQVGTVQVGYCSPTAATMNPNLNAFDLPFLFEDYDHVERVVTSDIFERICAPFYDYGLRPECAYENGLRVISTTSKKIESLADLKGLKMRVPEAPISIAIFDALGCNTTPISFNELYSALQQGVVDGQENGYPTIDTNKYYEVQKYIAETYHMWGSLVLFVSDKFYQTLTPEQQQLVDECLVASGEYQRTLYREMQDSNKQHLIDNGVEVTYPDLQEWRDATAVVYDNFYKDYPDLKPIVEEIMAMRDN